MALPTLYALEECSDFSKTVAPFIPQLYDLPRQLFDAVVRREGLLDLYLDTNPLISAFALSIFLGAVFLVASELNRNYSQVDRFWSLLPTLYIAHFDVWARLSGIPSQRIDLVLLGTSIWSMRLTFNYWRKGGYSIGSEDYRWEIVRKQVPARAFHILNWTFISFIQSILLFCLAAPAYVVLLSVQFEPDIRSSDIAYLALEISLVVVEVFADQQQWDYQKAKKQYRKSAQVPAGYEQIDLDRGFIASGLWAYSRHPNFAAEQSIWFLAYQWSCYATRVLYNWTVAGPTVLILVFQGSTWLTELISSGKYPDYADYQRQVGKFVPARFSAYQSPNIRPKSDVKPKADAKPKVIRISDLPKKQEQKQEQGQGQQQKQQQKQEQKPKQRKKNN